VGVGQHSLAAQTLKDRGTQPRGETVTLQDYRTATLVSRRPRPRRAPPGFPMISIVDDHEITNNAWRGGASNHDAARR
jgi:alkaline phosphatase D